MNLKDAKNRLVPVPNITTALPSSSAESAAADSARPKREIPQAKSFHDIFIPQGKSFKVKSFASMEDSLSSRLAEMKGIQLPASGGDHRQRQSSEGSKARLPGQGQRRQRAPGAPKGNKPKRQGDATKKRQRAQRDERKASAAQTTPLADEGEVDDHLSTAINVTTNFEDVFRGLPAPAIIPAAPPTQAQVKGSKSNSSNSVAATPPKVNAQIPATAASVIAARTQLFLERNGGEYSRYGTVYGDIVKEKQNTPTSLGPVRFAALYINRHPEAGLNQRKNALRVVQDLTGKLAFSRRVNAP